MKDIIYVLIFKSSYLRDNVYYWLINKYGL